MKQFKFEVSAHQLHGFCPAQMEGTTWKVKSDGQTYHYEVAECYFNEDNDDLVEVLVTTNQNDAEPEGIQDGFLWAVDARYEHYLG